MKWDKEKLEGYNPGEIEAKWYDFWEKEGYFHQDPDSSREPYSIVMPPPNVTGQLHMGHWIIRCRIFSFALSACRGTT